MDRTIIGSTIEIDGDVEGDDAVVVQGRVKGRIHVEQNVIVERGGHVEADVDAATLQIAGQVEGNVVARARVEITAEGRMNGNIRAPRIAIADGAHYRGNIEMD